MYTNSFFYEPIYIGDICKVSPSYKFILLSLFSQIVFANIYTMVSEEKQKHFNFLQSKRNIKLYEVIHVLNAISTTQLLHMITFMIIMHKANY